jgi:hypothetical protein
MLKALYFPHTTINNPTIIKNALLLWDCVETIVPAGKWTPHRGTSREIRHAAELVVRHRIPKSSEQHSAHGALQQLLAMGIPADLLRAGPRFWRDPEYLIYPQKFLDSTWKSLTELGLARWVDEAEDYGVPPALGLLMMSMLADACAGTQIQKITDQAAAYNWIAEAHAKALGSQYISGLDISQIAPAYDRLVSISLEVVDARAIPLKRLIRMRERELKSRSSDYTLLRRRYLKTLQEYIKKIGTEARSVGDVKELEGQFKADIKEDLQDLKSELSLAGTKALLSKEVALSALVVAGALVSPITGITTLPSEIGGLGVVPLGKAWADYKGARRDIVRRHFMSWLYLGTRRLTLT